MNHTTAQQSGSSRWSPDLLIALPQAPTNAAASMLLAEHGVPVFPCAPGAKQPLTAHGFHDASTNLETVRAWWLRWPAANIAVPTGRLSRVDVLDVDVHPTGTGFAAFERARSAGIADGWAWLVRTPSGGIHAYFLRDERTGEQRSWQAPGQHVDFRGDGGYIVVPPSRVTVDGQSRHYELIAVAQHQARAVDAEAVRSLVAPPRPTRSPAGRPAAGSRPDQLTAWVASRPQGTRNGGLFWAACRMVEEGHPLASATDLLATAATQAGLPEREALATIRSAYRVTSPRGPATPAGPTTGAEAVSL